MTLLFFFLYKLVFGPTFPNETNNEALLNGRQRFGHRSANMFFVRPARHIACPRRLKYIHGLNNNKKNHFCFYGSTFIDIKTGYIPYVEDEPYSNQPNYRHVLQKINDDFMNSKNNLNGIGLCKCYYILYFCSWAMMMIVYFKK